MSNFTKGDWIVDSNYTSMLYITSNGHGVCEVDADSVYDVIEVSPTTEQRANAQLIAAAPDMYHMIKSLSDELELAINEINTMRDIHHTDNLTPADHWDQESLHLAQVLLAKARGEIK